MKLRFAAADSRGPAYWCGTVFALLLGLTSTLAAAHGATVSSIYIAGDADAYEVLELVQTPDGRLSGVYGFHKVDQTTGEIANTAATALGSADGSRFFISLRPTALLPIAVDMTGYLEDETLTLTVPGKPSTALRRSDNQARTRLQESMRQRSLQISSQHARNKQYERERKTITDLAATVQRVRQRAEALEERSRKAIAGYAASEARYRTITQKMQTLLTRMEPLAAGDTVKTFMARIQLGRAIREGASTRRAVHESAHSKARDIATALARLETDASKADSGCTKPHDQHVATREATAVKSLMEACRALLLAMDSARARARTVPIRLAILEAAYAEEEPKQTAIEARAEAIERL